MQAQLGATALHPTHPGHLPKLMARQAPQEMPTTNPIPKCKQMRYPLHDCSPRVQSHRALHAKPRAGTQVFIDAALVSIDALATA